MKRCCVSAVIFVILCLITGRGAEEEKADKKRQTYVVRYKNGEQTIPVTVVLDYKKQTEYVINMNSRTPSKSVTLYDFKQRTIAYKDLSNQECFLGRLNHETLNNESLALQNLKNPVESKPEILSMDGQRPALTPTEIRNIAGQKTAMFCRKMNTWLLEPDRKHERRKRSDDYGETMYDQRVHQNRQRDFQRRPRNPNRKSSDRRLQTHKNAARNQEQITNHPSRFYSTRRNPTSDHYARYREYGNAEHLQPDRFHHTEVLRKSETKIRNSREHSYDINHKTESQKTSDDEVDYNSNQEISNPVRLTNFKGDSEFPSLHILTQNRGDNTLISGSSSSNIWNSNDFNNIKDDENESRDSSYANQESRTQNTQDYLSHNKKEEETSSHSFNQTFREKVKDYYTNSSTLHQVSGYEIDPSNFREDLEDNSKSFPKIDYRVHEDDSDSFYAVSPETLDSNFERLSERSKISKFGEPKQSSQSESFEIGTELENYLSESHRQDHSNVIRNSEDHPELKNDYYATSYLFPKAKPIDHSDESSVLHKRFPFAPLQEHANIIYRNDVNNITYHENKRDLLTTRTRATTEGPNAYYYNTHPSRSIDESNEIQTESTHSTTEASSILISNSLHPASYKSNGRSTNQKSSRDEFDDKIYFPLTTVTTPSRYEQYNVPNHRSDVPSEENFQTYPEPGEKIRQRQFDSGLSQIPNVTVNEGFPAHQRRIQNVLRLFTPDEIIIDIGKLPTVQTPNSVAGFHRRPTVSAEIPSRRISANFSRAHRNRNEYKTRKSSRFPTTRVPLKSNYPPEASRRQPKEGITYHVRQDTRLHPQHNALPPGVSMHPRHPQAPFAGLAHHNNLPSMIPEGNPVLKPHRQRHLHKKHRSSNSCCQRSQGYLSSCCRDGLERRRPGLYKKSPLLPETPHNFRPQFPMVAEPQTSVVDTPRDQENPSVTDTRNRCERERMCRTLYQSTQQVLVCRNGKIDGC